MFASLFSTEHLFINSNFYWLLLLRPKREPSNALRALRALWNRGGLRKLEIWQCSRIPRQSLTRANLNARSSSKLKLIGHLISSNGIVIQIILLENSRNASILKIFRRFFQLFNSSLNLFIHGWIFLWSKVLLGAKVWKWKNSSHTNF